MCAIGSFVHSEQALSSEAVTARLPREMLTEIEKLAKKE
jgi:hypothetical protein